MKSMAWGGETEKKKVALILRTNLNLGRFEGFERNSLPYTRLIFSLGVHQEDEGGLWRYLFIW